MNVINSVFFILCYIYATNFLFFGVYDIESGNEGGTVSDFQAATMYSGLKVTIRPPQAVSFCIIRCS
jgi:hypothetical protein